MMRFLLLLCTFCTLGKALTIRTDEYAHYGRNKFVGVGRLCQHTDDCPNRQYCIKGICRCYDGQVLLNNQCVWNEYCYGGQQIYHDGKCYYLSPIGGRCIVNEQCYGDSACINTYCTCIEGMINVNGVCQSERPDNHCKPRQILYSGKCLNLVLIGEQCQAQAQCTGGAHCLNQHCTCPIGTVQDGQKCREQKCSGNEVSISGKCLLRIIPGERCQDTAQCLDGSHCSSTSRYCVCPKGMNVIDGYCRRLSYADPCNPISTIYANGSCLSVVKPGNQCVHNSQCLGGSFCMNGYCNCPTTAVLLNGYCVGSVLCTQDEVQQGNRCFKKVRFNEPCEISEQCPDNAICNFEAICACAKGMEIMDGRCYSYQTIPCQDTEVMVSGKCVRRTVPGAKCFTNEQCLDGSQCIHDYCICPSGTNLLSGYCVKSSTGGNCGAYQTFVNGQCLHLAPPGFPCISNVQCLASSICVAGKCLCFNGSINVENYCIQIDRSSRRCKDDQVQVLGRCYPRINFGGHCQFTEQCILPSSCLDGICTCPPGTELHNNACQRVDLCRHGYVYVEGRCFAITYLGQYCQVSQQCQGNAICERNICTCPSSTTAQGMQCVADMQCSYKEVMISNMCYKQANIGEFCHYTEQCLGKAECLLNSCTCPLGTVNVNDTCIIFTKCEPYQILVNDNCFDTVSIGMACEDSAQCIASASCVPGITAGTNGNKTCQCNNGTIFTGSTCMLSAVQCPMSTVYISEKFCQFLVQIGQFCFYTSQCMGYSVCHKHVCKCPVDYVAIRNVCRRL